MVLEGLYCSLFESLWFSLVTFDVKIFIFSCNFVSSLSDVVSLVVVNAFPL